MRSELIDAFISAAVLCTMLTSMPAICETFNFDDNAPGLVPPGWQAGVTGRGSFRWAVRADPSAPSPPHVMEQSGTGDFPWLARSEVALEDGFVEVKFKAISGRQDQAAGVVWRWKDGKRYYVARANALENNVSLYYTEGGRRNTLKYVDAPVARGTWHRLRVEFIGRRIVVMLNGKTFIDLEDAHISGAGGVGLWTKADSVTAFDDFSYGAAQAGPK